MFEFPINKYKFFNTDKKVIAVSSFGGKTVRGVAVCSNGDEFDLTAGKELAAARCNLKVAKKRFKRAKDEYEYYESLIQYVENEFKKASKYYADSKTNLEESQDRVNKLIENM